MSAESLGSRLAQALKTHGVDTIFGIPGVHNVELYRGIEQAGIRHILARHEQGAGFMADGYARATGKPGIAFIISGPGVTNIMTPMGQAYSDSVPMLVISSCLPLGPSMPGRLHEMRDQTGAAAAVCDWSICAEDAESAFILIDRAFSEFESGRARPKHITIPIDVLGELGAMPKFKRDKASSSNPDTNTVSKITNMLNAAKKPLFIFGGGSVGASQIANALVEKSGAAVFTTYAGRGVVSASYPLNFGATLSRPDSARAIAQADLVIAVGTELAEVDLWRDKLGHRGVLVRIDIDNMVLDDLHGASVKICADANATLSAMTALALAAPEKWNAKEIAQTKAAFRAEADSERPGIAPYVDALQRVLPSDCMFYSDMTQFAYVAKELYAMEKPGHWHHPFGFGTLGYALPAAIGGKLARPNQPVVAIAGDYGFQYTIQELGVAAEFGLNLPIVLWDNGKLKEIEDSMIQSQIAPNAVVAKNPDFGKLAEAYGIGFAAPKSPEEFETEIAAALVAKRPTLVHIGPD
ncbi:MAG: 5-guanidino-2-oxopentanoate decarboxylase [Paracoccaceae bacterium]